MADLQKALQTLQNLQFSKMYEGDFFLTWEKTDDEIRATFEVAEALRALREHNVSPKIFDSG
ncbi:MAG TPA: knotted carbamoyltransferase YgeW, partial [Candidatus Limiplasma sp.]|nr:knotted carbamoyltransferase YgeW [Candidatus Limiplasma sp.]